MSTHAWRCLSENAPEHLQRSSHAIGVIKDEIYLFGGEHEPRHPVDNKLYKAQMKESTNWEEVAVPEGAPSPCARIAPALVAVGSKLYVFGGRVGITMGEGGLDDLWVFDAETGAWTLVMEHAHENGGPLARSFHQMVATNGKLYVFAGCGARGRMSDLHSFDISTGQWEALPSCDTIKGRGGAGLVAVGEKVMVIAGFAGEETRDMYVFDSESKAWTDWSAHSQSLVPRSVLGVAPLGTDKIVLFGGEVDPSSQGHEGAGGFAGDTLVLDLTAPEKGWTPASLKGRYAPSPRGWYAYTACAHGFVLHGGLVPSNDRKGDLWVLSTSD